MSPSMKWSQLGRASTSTTTIPVRSVGVKRDKRQLGVFRRRDHAAVPFLITVRDPHRLKRHLNQPTG